MIREFKEFVGRGNVMDLAVAVVIGAAFTAIVNSLVKDVIMPIVGILLGGVDFTALALTFGAATITYGNFIQAVVNFLVIAWVVFLVVKAMNRFQRAPAAPEEAPGPTVEELLGQIRDLLKEGAAHQ
jgi:large conductance mechanosensitive channel